MSKAKSASNPNSPPEPPPANFPFKFGDIVVEPTIGICKFAGLRRTTVDGVVEDLFVFEAPGTAKVLVPRSQLGKRGIRKPMTREEAKKILMRLKVPVSPDRSDARMQYPAYREIMKSGDPEKIVRLLRELYILEQSNELKGKEKEIMEQAMKFVCDEISYIRGASKNQVLEAIKESLRQMHKKKIQLDKEKGRKSGPQFPSSYAAREEEEEDSEEFIEEEEAGEEKKEGAARSKRSLLDEDEEEGELEEEVLEDEEEV